jgi:hypothetical protein
MSLLGKNALFGTAVMAALGVPFALSDKEETSASRPATPDAAEASSATAGAPASLPGWRSDGTPLEGPAVANLEEVLRFDVTPAWLIQRWPRVMNARHAGGSLQAYRVPLVTGAKESDLAGSLTYYFNESQTLQRIQFQGNTGDAGPLANFLVQQHNFQRRTSGDPSQMIYDVRRDGKAVSQLIVRSAPLIDAAAPQSRYHVELTLERPSDHKIFSDATGHRFDSHRWP